MAETLGSLADKLSIVELRRWHTEEAMCNADADVEVRHECALRLRIIDEQRRDLIDEITQMWSRHRRWPNDSQGLQAAQDVQRRPPAEGERRRL